ncbi:hypothetical protein C7Y66_25215 [Chroococcidiopsis sp. CCALA 051]|uniref:aminoacyl--tRNA ligase-related protein n=1 Tax=Chroococcidiopsis sp. CCALA 051 TaxID=869949 RepID=UPI000D0DEABB|nr:aminoacyl--tRNA ligase-related protein [Chroococcidiopsis sp. CCALA 051]PSM46393.1 hypothetical protein C7Y66_25215 [Chroococcidiopsis sp. CCALA 051]
MSSETFASLESENIYSCFNSDAGLLTLQGSQVELRRRLDALFCSWAEVVGAIEYSFPPVLSVYSLDLADYFSSFPHLATLTTQIDSNNEGMKRFVDSTRNERLTEVDQNYLTPARYVLPSAACYAVYNHLSNKKLQNDLFITVCSPCFRQESIYKAGERQWTFHMREIVCIGRQETVRNFLNTYRQLITEILDRAKLPFQLREATDPFFDKRDPALILQKLEPLKYEFLYRDRLAITSLNFHRKFFGDRFNIQDCTGEPAYTGCVAFGLERWLSACIREYGQNWENLPAVLQKKEPEVRSQGSGE